MENPLERLLPNHKYGIVVGDDKEFYKWYSKKDSVIGLEITNQEYIYLYLDICYIDILDIIPSRKDRLRPVHLFTDLKINKIYV